MADLRSEDEIDDHPEEVSLAWDDDEEDPPDEDEDA